MRERPKGSGDWWVYVDHQGDRKAKKIGRDKRLAVDVAKEIEAKLILGEMNLDKPDNKAPKFEEYATTWIDVTVPATCKPSTVSSHKGLLDNHILPQFGPKPVNEINRLMVKNFLMGKYKSGHASSTVGHMKSAISDLKHRRKLETVKQGWKRMPDWVFISSVGTPLDINHWRRRVFDKAL